MLTMCIVFDDDLSYDINSWTFLTRQIVILLLSIMNKENKFDWSHEAESLLISLVSEKPDIYNNRSRRYSDVNYKTLFFQEILAVMKLSFPSLCGTMTDKGKFYILKALFFYVHYMLRLVYF